MLHIGDYVFLAIISCSVYMVAVRLVDLVHGRVSVASHSQREMENRTPGVQQ